MIGTRSLERSTYEKSSFSNHETCGFEACACDHILNGQFGRIFMSGLIRSNVKTMGGGGESKLTLKSYFSL